MVDPSSAQFISSLVKSLQMFCHGYMDFEDNIEIIGHINLRIDNRHKLDYIVSEHVSKQGQESTCFQSNSYHSLPPRNGSDQQSSRENLHSVVDSPMAVLGGTRIQVDLSGPSPVTRSTFASYPDGFLNPQGSGQTYSQKRVSPAYDSEQTTDAKGSASATPQGHISHPHAFSKDTKGSASVMQGHSFSLPHTLSKDVRLSDSAGAESAMPVVVSSHSDGQQQNLLLSGHLQNVTIKAEPGTLSLAEKSGDSNSMGSEEMMETSSASVCTVQAPVLSASMAYSQPASRPSVSFTPPVTFDTSLLPLDPELSCQETGRQEGGVLKSAAGTPVAPAATVSPVVAPALKPTLYLTQDGLRVLFQGMLPSSAQSMTLPTIPSTEDKDRPFTVLSSQPVAKKPKAEGAQCGECGTHFRNSRLLGMHMRLVHKKMPLVKLHKPPIPDGAVKSPLLLPSSPAVIACVVGAKSEEKELAKPPGVQLASETFLDLTKARNGSSNTISANSFLELTKNKNDSPNTVILSQTSAPKDSDRNGPAACCFCQILFWNSQDLTEHQKLCGQKYSVESAGGQSSNVCQHCQLVFPDPTLLAEHRKSCEVSPALMSVTTCPLCHLSFPDPALLSAHLWVCGKTPAATPTTNLAELSTCESGASAAGTSSSVSSNVNSCVKCGKVFQGRTSLVDHMNSMHKGMSFKCPDCGETFKWRTCVYRHKARCCKRKNAAAAKQKEGDCKN